MQRNESADLYTTSSGRCRLLRRPWILRSLWLMWRVGCVCWLGEDEGRSPPLNLEAHLVSTRSISCRESDPPASEKIRRVFSTGDATRTPPGSIRDITIACRAVEEQRAAKAEPYPQMTLCKRGLSFFLVVVPFSPEEQESDWFEEAGLTDEQSFCKEKLLTIFGVI